MGIAYEGAFLSAEDSNNDLMWYLKEKTDLFKLLALLVKMILFIVYLLI